MPVISFLDVYSDNFGYIRSVVRIRGKEFSGDTVVGKKSAFLQVVAVKLTAYKNEFSLCECHAAVYFSGSKTCLLCLVAVSARMGAAEGKSISLFFAEKACSKAFIFINELISIAVRSDIAGQYIFIPKNAELTP